MPSFLVKRSGVKNPENLRREQEITFYVMLADNIRYIHCTRYIHYIRRSHSHKRCRPEPRIQ